MEEISSTYRGNLLGDEVRVFVAGEGFCAKKQVEIDSKSKDISSLDYFAISILSDTMLAIKSSLSSTGVKLYDFEAKIKITLKNSLFAFDVKGFDEPCKISAIKLRFYINSLQDDTKELCQNALKKSILYQSLKDFLQIEPSFYDVL